MFLKPTTNTFSKKWTAKLILKIAIKRVSLKNMFHTYPKLVVSFQVPLCVIVAWTMGVDMDLDFNLLETGSLGFSILVTGFTLQVYITIPSHNHILKLAIILIVPSIMLHYKSICDVSKKEKRKTQKCP